MIICRKEIAGHYLVFGNGVFIGRAWKLPHLDQWGWASENGVTIGGFKCRTMREAKRKLAAVSRDPARKD